MHLSAFLDGETSQALLAWVLCLNFDIQLAKEHNMHRLILVTSPFHQKRTYLTFAKVLQPHGITLFNYYADTGEWHPLTWFLRAEHRRLVTSERARIKLYRQKGDLL